MILWCGSPMPQNDTPMKLNISQAAKAVGKDRKTLYRHAEKGRLTVGKDGNGNPVIDVSELERVYGTLNLNATPDTVGKIGAKPQNDTPKKSNDNTALKREIELLREQVGDLRSERDRLLKVIEEQTTTVKLLTDQSQPKEESHRHNWEGIVATVLIFALGLLVFQYWPVLIR